MVADDGGEGRRANERAAVSSSTGRLQPGADHPRRRPRATPPDVNVGDGFAGPTVGVARLLVRQLQVPPADGARGGSTGGLEREVDARAASRPSSRRHVQRREPRRPSDAATKFDALASDRRRQPAQRRTSWRVEEMQDNNGATRRRHDGRDARPSRRSSTRSPPPAARATSSARSTRRTRPTAASPAATSASASCSAPTAALRFVDRPGRRRRRPPTERRPTARPGRS